ncbi:branched-chain amino acid ABC transporter permease [Streptomyces sp. NBC_01614]|uniref:branched-chain amino acid ABC transporter permease n=1 Tax=Streptomyces sp. NBC_01614 TaxID=2975897 RepID=UPI003868EB8C
MKRTFVRHTVFAIAGLAAVGVLTALVSPYWQFELTRAICMLCAAAGLTVLIGLSGQISAGQGAFIAVGAYTTALLLNSERSSLVLALVTSAATAGGVGMLVGLVCTRLRRHYLAGATLALALALPSLTNLGPLRPVLQAENGLSVPIGPLPAVFGTSIPVAQWQAWVAGASATVVLWLLANLSASRYGRILRAVRDDEAAAALSGIRVARVRLIAFVVSAVCGGLAGGLLAWVTSLAAPGAFTLILSLMLIAAVVIGGLGSLMGAIWGSLLLVLVPIWVSNFSVALELPVRVENNLPNGVFGVILTIMIIIFPAGIQGGLAKACRRAGPRMLSLMTFRRARGSDE